MGEKANPTGSDGITESVARRGVLKRLGTAAAVGAGSTATFTGRTRASECSYGIVMSEGTTYNLRRNDEADGRRTTTFHVDNNWGLTFTGVDSNENYTFETNGVFHTYIDEEDYVTDWNTQEEVKLDVALRGNDYGDTDILEASKWMDDGSVEPFTTLSGLYGPAYLDWKNEHKKNSESEASSESEIKSAIDRSDYVDNDVPEWVQGAAFAAGVAAGGLSGGALPLIIGGTAFAVDTIAFVEWLADFKDDAGKNTEHPYENGNESFYYWWNPEHTLGLTSVNSGFTVSVDGQESEPFYVDIKLSYDVDELNGAYGKDKLLDTDNVAHWTIEIPPNGDNPVMCSETYYDGKGHSHL
ncbi:hypothetical protein [Natronomonas marina]|jgi:hypothetical protein|uniref:hypothetical protein n=1 Tax=Natronomonas marina TaxID=2961939 RepID=UPI0020C97749|nr:hypothetical protein [Natronomonas marina]